MRGRLLRAAKEDAVPAGARARTIATVVGGAAAVHGRAALASTAKAWLAKIGLVVALGLGAAGLYQGLARDEQPARGQRTSSRAVVAAPAESESPPSLDADGSGIVAVGALPEASSVASPPEASTRAVRRTRAVGSSKAAPPPPSASGERGTSMLRGVALETDIVDASAPAPVTSATAESASALPSARLALEVAQLERVRSALARSDARAALEELAAYRRDFPRAQLTREATLLEIEALERTGERGRAASLARELVRMHPESAGKRQLAPYVE